jgi:hypothetical protein
LGITIVACAISAIAHADERAASAPPAAIGRGWVEVAGEVHREAWNYNVSDEDLFGGTAGLWYPAGTRWSIGAEATCVYVNQERVSSAPFAGVALILRRHFARRALTYFVEGGGGLSYAARFVPPRGTRFNYIFETGVGIIHPTSRYAHFIASLRFLHLSNNGLAGRDRNPDIEAFGLRLGVLLPLNP